MGYLKQTEPKENITDVLKLIIGRSSHVWKDLKPSSVSKESFLSQTLPSKDVVKGNGDGVLNDKVMLLHDDHPLLEGCLLYTSPSPRDRTRSRMPSSA